MYIVGINLYNDILKFYHSGAFLTIKILLGIYSFVLFADIVLLVIQKGLGGSVREGYLGMNIPRGLATQKNKTREKWLKIRKKLESHNPNDYKVAIIEADDIIDGLVKGLGYPGENFGDRLNAIPDSQIENIEGMKQSHEVRNRIIHDDRFVVSKEDADIALKQYEEFLDSFQVLD